MAPSVDHSLRARLEGHWEALEAELAWSEIAAPRGPVRVIDWSREQRTLQALAEVERVGASATKALVAQLRALRLKLGARELPLSPGQVLRLVQTTVDRVGDLEATLPTLRRVHWYGLGTAGLLTELRSRGKPSPSVAPGPSATSAPVDARRPLERYVALLRSPQRWSLAT